jgi:hypothetical protein
LAGQVADGRPLVLWVTPSAGARVGLAASRAGLDLSGATFVVIGEAVTAARRAQIEACGARVIVGYTSIELSASSYSCATPAASDDLHAMIERFALIRRPRPAMPGGPIVDALLVSSLSAAVPTIALNAEMGDYARLEERDCGCLLGSLGLRTHLSEIRSFEKLTGEGVTFARANLQAILEEALPARFGGTSLDYQLAEEEGPEGATRLVLRVNPALGELDEAALRETFLAELGRGSLLNRYHVGLWRGVGAVEVRREAPLATPAGKVLPFQLLRRGEQR